MSRSILRAWSAGACAVACWLTAGLAAAAPVLRDPAVPEALRHTAPAPITHGDALRAQVEAKLRARFERADTSTQGHITRAQAEAAGLGYVAQHFDAIDALGHGSVSWTQVREYLQRRERAVRSATTPPAAP